MRWAVWVFLLPSFAMAASVLDETGVRVELVERPARIVTLAPSLAELAADLDTEHIERIVGVSEYTDYPPSLKKVQSVGPYHRFNLERVVALKPDLVLATKDGNAEDQVKHLRELGLKVVVIDSVSLLQIAKSMRLVGQAMGVGAAGERMARAFEAGLEARRAKKRAIGTRTVLQFGDEPLVVAGKESFLTEALALLGLKNAYGEVAGRYIRPSLEDAVARDPEAIIVIALGDDMKPFEKMAAQWSRFPKLKAVQQKRVRVLRADALLRPTLRFLDGLSLLESKLDER